MKTPAPWSMIIPLPRRSVWPDQATMPLPGAVIGAPLGPAKSIPRW